jgi:hypothetical protein
MSRALWTAGLTTIVMQSLAQFSVQLFRRLIDRFRAWRTKDQPQPSFETPFTLNFPTHIATIHRDVTSTGVRVYSLCCDCGSRLNASATLCEECAQKRRHVRPY